MTLSQCWKSDKKDSSADNEEEEEKKMDKKEKKKSKNVREEDHKMVHFTIIPKNSGTILATFSCKNDDHILKKIENKINSKLKFVEVNKMGWNNRNLDSDTQCRQAIQDCYNRVVIDVELRVCFIPKL